MAEVFRLEAEELGKVAGGLRDVESQLKARASRLRGQLGAGGTPWQFPGGPGGVQSNVEDAQHLVDPSMTTAVAGLADYLQKIVSIFVGSDQLA